jgi:putative transposase
MDMICRLFGKTRQAWYFHHHQLLEQEKDDIIILDMVRIIRNFQPKIGTRKLYFMIKPMLEKHEIKIGRDKLFSFMNRYNLHIKQKRRKMTTTNSNHWYRKYDNLIKGFVPTAINQVWVSDITYISLVNGFAFLSLITDMYSKKIVGYCLYPTLEANGCLIALSRAIELKTGSLKNLIHHSDRGIQYCCDDYTSMLQINNITISMTQNGDPYENAVAERVNGILKYELSLVEDFRSFEHAQSQVEHSITTYNTLRPHSSCGYLTPEQAHLSKEPLTKIWKNYYQKTEQAVKLF